MNSTPQTIAELNDLPVKTINGSTIYMRDVAHVRDGFAPQTNIVRQDGVRGTLMSIYKIGNGVHADHCERGKRHRAHRRAVAAPGTSPSSRCSTSRCSCALPSTECCARH